MNFRSFSFFLYFSNNNISIYSRIMIVHSLILIVIGIAYSLSRVDQLLLNKLLKDDTKVRRGVLSFARSQAKDSKKLRKKNQKRKKRENASGRGSREFSRRITSLLEIGLFGHVFQLSLIGGPLRPVGLSRFAPRTGVHYRSRW